MAVCTDRSVIYHVPKCGGIWVKEAVRSSGLRYGRCKDKPVAQPFGLKREHATPGVVRDECKEGRFAFCFVRHPVGWYKSFWAYRAKTGWLDARFPADRWWEDEFELFVLNMLDAYPGGFVSELYRFYVDGVDFVGRQERLADDLVRALTLAGEAFDEAALRRTRWRNMSASGRRFRSLALSEGTAARVLDAERWAVERFYG